MRRLTRRARKEMTFKVALDRQHLGRCRNAVWLDHFISWFAARRRYPRHPSRPSAPSGWLDLPGGLYDKSQALPSHLLPRRRALYCTAALLACIPQIRPALFMPRKHFQARRASGLAEKLIHQTWPRHSNSTSATKVHRGRRRYWDALEGGEVLFQPPFF